MKRLTSLALVLMMTFNFCLASKAEATTAVSQPEAGQVYYLYQYGSGGRDALTVDPAQVNVKGEPIIRSRFEGGLNQAVAVTFHGDWVKIHFLGYSAANPSTSRDFVLDANNNSGSVTQYTETTSNNNNQLWKLIPDEDNTFRILNRKTGLYLTCASEGQPYVLRNWKKSATSTQRFQFKPMDGVFIPTCVGGSSKVQSSSRADFEKKVKEVCLASLGENYTWTQAPKGTPWCGYYIKEVAKQCGLSEKNIPISQLTGVINIAREFEENTYGGAFFFTDWAYNEIRIQKNTTTAKVTPRIGDLVLLETNGNQADGPDHVEIIIDVSKGHFTTCAGNSGPGSTTTRTIREQEYNLNDGLWHRDGAPSVIDHAICRPEI